MIVKSFIVGIGLNGNKFMNNTNVYSPIFFNMHFMEIGIQTSYIV
jgi:hypothetical protein